MGQDLREMFRNEEEQSSEKLDKGHRKRFEAKLDDVMPQKSSGSRFLIWKIAAVLVLAFGVGFVFFNPLNQETDGGNAVVETSVSDENEGEETIEQFQVSKVSPEFKKVEDYYLANLNFELSKLEVTEENKALMDSFMKQLAELEKEYQRLNDEFSELGANEQTLEAMIVNLQLRLELLYKVKSKIKEIKQTKNESYEDYQV